ncbi:hypothetical protein [Poriferisphaera sp. WC338]|uniref:hypothetical protein n=1 Tax=Poriferisphaera sp. WC338 TaxID=3425129 RepID=UPI003D81A606
MAEIEIGTETEKHNGWSYEVRVFEEGRVLSFAVTLSFADYDLWSGGSIPPSRVVHKAFLFLLKNEPATSILSKFDCSIIRRYFPQVDQELPKMSI